MDTLDSCNIKYNIRAIRQNCIMKTIIHGFYDQRVIILHANDEKLYDVEGKIFRKWKNAEVYAFKLLRKKVNEVITKKD